MFEGMKHTYDIAGKVLGYSGHFDDEVMEQVRRHPDVSTSETALIYTQRQVTTKHDHEAVHHACYRPL